MREPLEINTPFSIGHLCPLFEDALEQVMKYLVSITWLLGTLAITSAQARGAAYQSCDLGRQHTQKTQTGSGIKDARQAAISVRANVLQADISTARKAGRLSQALADSLWMRVDAIRKDTDRLTGGQGFLSAAEHATYDRNLDAVAMRLCR